MTSQQIDARSCNEIFNSEAHLQIQFTKNHTYTFPTTSESTKYPLAFIFFPFKYFVCLTLSPLLLAYSAYVIAIDSKNSCRLEHEMLMAA